MSDFSLSDLERIVEIRARASTDESWTAKLVAAGQTKAAKKLGEEAVETVIAAVQGDAAAIASESADLLYHWLVVLAASGVDLDAVAAQLEAREGVSGLDEKASRGRS